MRLIRRGNAIAEHQHSACISVAELDYYLHGIRDRSIERTVDACLIHFSVLSAVEAHNDVPKGGQWSGLCYGLDVAWLEAKKDHNARLWMVIIYRTFILVSSLCIFLADPGEGPLAHSAVLR